MRVTQARPARRRRSPTGNSSSFDDAEIVFVFIDVNANSVSTPYISMPVAGEHSSSGTAVLGYSLLTMPNSVVVLNCLRSGSYASTERSVTGHGYGYAGGSTSGSGYGPIVVGSAASASSAARFIC